MTAGAWSKAAANAPSSRLTIPDTPGTPTGRPSRRERLAREVLRELHEVAIGIADVRRALAPGKIGRGHGGRRAAGDELCVCRVAVIDLEAELEAGPVQRGRLELSPERGRHRGTLVQRQARRARRELRVGARAVPERQAQQVAVEAQRALDVVDNEHDIVGRAEP